MVKKFNLSDAAKAILNEGSKETFNANISSKQGARSGNPDKGNEVGINKLPSSVAYGEKEAGLVGQSPEKSTEELPDYLKGVPSATPPGATPPVGSEKDGVGATKATGPQDDMGRKDIMHPVKADATDYEAIRDRIAGKLPANTFKTNPNGTFQHYDGTATAGNQSIGSSSTGGANEDTELEGDSIMETISAKVREDVEALLSGENLSEEFTTKATTIFEAAVVSRVIEIKNQLEESLVQEYETAVEEMKEDFAEKLDGYLNYVAEQFMSKNELAIESGLRAEIVEDFMTGLRNLFIENYIDVPEEKVDVVEEMAQENEEIKAKLNEAITVTIELQKEINEHKKTEAIHTVCEGLTQTQVEKIKALAENVEYTTEEEFAGKLNTIKESYFPSGIVQANKSALEEGVEFEEEKTAKKSSDPLMNVYANAISKSLK